jgi:hypothetical protein
MRPENKTRSRVQKVGHDEDHPLLKDLEYRTYTVGLNFAEHLGVNFVALHQ